MKRLVSICLLFLLIVGMGFTQTDLQTIATVNLIRSEPIMVKQLRTETEKIEAGRTLSADDKRKLRLEILNLMIDEKLILQAAEQERISVSENDLNNYFQQIRSGITQSLGKRPTDAEFASLIKSQTGMELPAYRDLIRKQLIAQQYLRLKRPALESSIKTPTDAEIQDTYNLYKTQFVQPDTVRFSYIQFPLNSGAAAAEKNRARESAERMLRDIGSSAAKFDEAVIRGQTQGAGYISEEGRYLPRNPQLLDSVGQDFLSIAFSLPQGAISGVIETPQGFLIIKVTGSYEMKTLSLNDVLLQPGPPMTVREQIAGTLTQQRLQEATLKAQEELIAELRARRNAVTIRENFLLSW
ncbi:MAG: peptidyl-prolyl cis-trans isomerase [Spirochaetaceae bacterium]|nr:peptidyl-prolyl cis-trans isomerase [Spirochaetaceae bacterium]